MAKEFIHTPRFRRGKLPHWEVEHGRYFVTVRLADSLPRAVIAQLQEIHQNLAALTTNTEQFAALQREYFRSMEKYLHASSGACLLRAPECAEIVSNELAQLAEWNVDVPHFSIMPNHWHALLLPHSTCVHSLGEMMKRVKGRTGLRLRQIHGGHGAVWQREWFDR